MSSLLSSRKFWLMIVDVLVSAGIYFIAKYADPMFAEDALWMIGLLQPVIISVITGIAVEDAAEKSQQLYFVEDGDEIIQ